MRTGNDDDNDYIMLQDNRDMITAILISQQYCSCSGVQQRPAASRPGAIMT